MVSAFSPYPKKKRKINESVAVERVLGVSGVLRLTLLFSPYQKRERETTGGKQALLFWGLFLPFLHIAAKKKKERGWAESTCMALGAQGWCAGTNLRSLYLKGRSIKWRFPKRERSVCVWGSARLLPLLEKKSMREMGVAVRGYCCLLTLAGKRKKKRWERETGVAITFSIFIQKEKDDTDRAGVGGAPVNEHWHSAFSLPLPKRRAEHPLDCAEPFQSTFFEGNSFFLCMASTFSPYPKKREKISGTLLKEVLVKEQTENGRKRLGECCLCSSVVLKKYGGGCYWPASFSLIPKESVCELRIPTLFSHTLPRVVVFVISERECH